MSRIIDEYPEYILEMLRQRKGYASDDDSFDGEFNSMNPDEVFDEVCEWEGLCGYGYTIRNWFEDIYGIELDAYQD